MYLDNLYEEYEVCVELDGTAAHPADEQWLDKRRDKCQRGQRPRHAEVRTAGPGRSPLRDRECRGYATAPPRLDWLSPRLRAGVHRGIFRLWREFRDWAGR
jgi:hypothetical protein